MAVCWYGIARTAPADRAAAWVVIDDGGSVKVVTGVTEIGAGILTAVAQIAAHEIGVKPEDVVIGDNDTARMPGPGHAGGSRQTFMVGNVVALACREARHRLVEVMAKAWDVDATLIHTGNGEVWAEGTNHRISMAEAVDNAKKNGVVPVGSANFGISPSARLDPIDGSGRPWQSYVFGCQVAEVEVDTVTGEVQVLGIWAAHDVGRAVNPQGARPGPDGGLQARQRPHEHPRLCQVHSADLARRATSQFHHCRGSRSDRPARRQRCRRIILGADCTCNHERDLRRGRCAHHRFAGDARKGADGNSRQGTAGV
jgi:CO/xanthine dehydrogenase Mo-binding subunit